MTVGLKRAFSAYHIIIKMPKRRRRYDHNL